MLPLVSLSVPFFTTALEERSLTSADDTIHFDPTGDGLTDSACLLSPNPTLALSKPNGKVDPNGQHPYLQPQQQQHPAAVTHQHQDILTCGVCLRDFSLCDIIKFIDHKMVNGCKYFPLDKFISDDCCSCMELDVDTATGDGHSPKQTNGEVVTNDDGPPPPEGQMPTPESDQPDQCSPPPVKKIKTEPNEVSEQTLFDHGDNKENENGDLRNVQIETKDTTVPAETDEVSASAVNEDEEASLPSTAVLQHSPCDATKDAQDQSEPDTELKKPVVIDTSQPPPKQIHNHLCRFYRRLYKHYQRALLNRLFFANTHTGEMTETGPLGLLPLLTILSHLFFAFPQSHSYFGASFVCKSVCR